MRRSLRLAPRRLCQVCLYLLGMAFLIPVCGQFRLFALQFMFSQFIKLKFIFAIAFVTRLPSYLLHSLRTTVQFLQTFFFCGALCLPVAPGRGQ